MQSISLVNEKLDAAGIQYESYLQNMGRQLFYMVAISYLTIYLAVIFLITANTVIGVQFLMLQQRAQRRYRTLIRLGAGYEVLCRSAKRQIRHFFSGFHVRLLRSAASSAYERCLPVCSFQEFRTICLLCF